MEDNTPKIEINPKDNVNVYVNSTDDGILHDLADHLTFFADGYKYNPKFKFGTWDGKIRLFSQYRHTMGRGLISRVQKWAELNGFQCDVDDTILQKNHIELNEFAEYIQDLNIFTKGKPINPYTFQYLGAYRALTDKRAVFEASTAGGKSLIIYMLIRYMLDHNLANKILIITDGTTLVSQLNENFIDYSSANRWNVDDNLHQIFAGQDKHTDKPICLSTWQSMAKQPISYLKQFDMVIVDEAHKVKAVSFTNILNKAINATYRIGLTGTLQDAKCHQYTIESLLGESIKLLSNKSARDMGITSQIKIEGIILNYSDEDKKTLQKINYISPAERKAGRPDKSYQNEMKFIIDHPARNNLVVDMISHVKGNSIVLIAKIEHGKELLKQFKAKHPDRKVFFVTGIMKKDRREEIRQIMGQETNTVIIASYGVFSTGIDIANLHNLFLCSPLESPIRLMQSLGRIGRKHKTKRTAVVYHFGDNLKVNRKNARDNHTLRHFKNCISKYDHEQIDYRLTEMALP